MELIPENELVVIKREMQNKYVNNITYDNTLCSVDFNVEEPIKIELKPVGFCKPGERYPKVTDYMCEADFEKWKVSYLQEFLADRGINKSGSNDVLVKNVFNALHTH